jgi:hypothetical protein
MTTPLEVRFQRALQKHRPTWKKLDFDPECHSLLVQLQEHQAETLARSFGTSTIGFHVDFIDSATLDACTFADDDEEPIIFIGLTVWACPLT